MRRLIRDISSVLIISGVLLVLDAGATLIWQEPVTAVIAMINAGNQIATKRGFGRTNGGYICRNRCT